MPPVAVYVITFASLLERLIALLVDDLLRFRDTEGYDIAVVGMCVDTDEVMLPRTVRERLGIGTLRHPLWLSGKGSGRMRNPL